MNNLKIVFKVSAVLGFFALGLIQLAAIYTFFADYWGWWFIFAAAAALFIAYTPFLGAIAGTIAAHVIWGWSLLGAFLLFFWPLAIYFAFTIIGGGAAVIAAITEVQSKKAS